MNVAFIPVRGGSKSIPLKNIKEIAGKPLVYWTVKAASECGDIDIVYVATDSDKIRETVERFAMENVTVIGRSAESASDTASTEAAMLEFAAKYNFENIVLIQATSPLLTSEDLRRGFKIFNQPETDSVLSAVRQKRFHWTVDETGNASPTNYDVYARPRRQEFPGYFVENGAFYITSRELLMQSGNRISGRIKLVEMSEETFYEIDEPSDWTIIESLMQKQQDQQVPSVIDNLRKIKMFLTDCDGCLTDGGMYYSENGDELKKFNTRDGMAFEILRNMGIITGIITSENVNLVRRRGEKLKLDIVECGVKNKLEKVKHLAAKYKISMDEIAYLGDDINDLDVIKAVGVGCSVADALLQVKNAADYVTKARGGEGAVREIVEKIIYKEVVSK